MHFHISAAVFFGCCQMNLLFYVGTRTLGLDKLFKENNPNAQKSLLVFINTFELKDVYRVQEPSGCS